MGTLGPSTSRFKHMQASAGRPTCWNLEICNRRSLILGNFHKRNMERNMCNLQDAQRIYMAGLVRISLTFRMARPELAEKQKLCRCGTLFEMRLGQLLLVINGISHSFHCTNLGRPSVLKSKGGEPAQFWRSTGVYDVYGWFVLPAMPTLCMCFALWYRVILLEGRYYLACSPIGKLCSSWY